MPLRPRFPAPDPARKVGLEAAGGRRDRARAGGEEAGGRKKEGGGEGAGRGGGLPSVCHSLSPSVYRGCAEWCAWRRRRLRNSIQPRLAGLPALGFSSPSEAPQPPPAPDPASRPGHGRAPGPRVPRLLRSARGGVEARSPGEAGGGAESSVSGAESSVSGAEKGAVPRAPSLPRSPGPPGAPMSPDGRGSARSARFATQARVCVRQPKEGHEIRQVG